MGQSCLDATDGVCERHLLIAQSNDSLRRALHRYFFRYFHKIFAAANPSDAELALRDVNLEITDLICGQDFGQGWPLGSELITTWRLICPSLRRVVLFTARDDVPGDIPGVDAVCHKPMETAVLYSKLIET